MHIEFRRERTFGLAWIHSPTHRIGATVLPLFLVLAIVGCGDSTPEVVPVQGKVLLDGKPLTKGSVATLPSAGRGAHGTLSSDGTFELTTFAQNDGARLGTHKVAVSSFDMIGTGPEAAQGRSLIPERYANPQSSGLTIEVTADGPNEPVLELSSK